MTKFILTAFLVFGYFNLIAQYSMWEEDFGTSSDCSISSADGFISTNGMWTIEAIGPNGIAAHNWVVGAQEAGMELNECGSSCMVDPDLVENTLYVTNESFNASFGAVFQNGPDSETHVRAVSPVVSFIDVTSPMALKLQYIYSGHPSTTCVLEYFDGTTWSDLWLIEETLGACGNAGEWTESIIPLPGDVSGNANVQFGIRWENTGPETMPAPELSFALDKIECSCTSVLEAGIDEDNILDPNIQPNPEVIYTYDEVTCMNGVSEIYYLSPWAQELFQQTTVVLECMAGCDEFCDPQPVVLEWEAPGCNAPPLSFEFNAINSAYGPGCSFEGYFDFPSGTNSVCAGSCLDFSFGWASEDYYIEVDGGATIQNLEFNFMNQSVEGQVCFDAPGTYTIYGSSSDYFYPCEWTSGSAEIQVTSPDVEPLITVSQNDICPGSCVDFGMEEIPGADVVWTFEGGTPATSNQQQPGTVCFNEPGNYGVSVSISGDAGCGYGELPEGFTVVDCGEAPVAAFSTAVTTVCIDECIDFTDESTGTNNETWEWTFEMANPVSSNEQNPTNVCYDTPGIYEVGLVVSNPAGTDELISQGFIEVIDCSDPPVADFSVSDTDFCVGDCIHFTDLSGGTGNSWLWTFEGAEIPSSTDQHPTNICYETPGSWTVTLSVTNPDGSDELIENEIIVVDPCWPEPDPSFEVTETLLCPGDCVDFLNNSTTTAEETWSWTFDGADTPESNEVFPQGICYSEPGVYDVSLEVTDVGGTHTQIQYNLITVEECPAPNAMFAVSESVICPGECVQINNLSTGIVTGYTWAFPENVVGDTAAINPELCFDSSATYSISLIAFNDEGESSEYTLEQAVIVDPCLPEISIEASEDRICVGDCISFTHASEEPSTNWQWTFPGAENINSFQESPNEICYTSPGVFDVTLQTDVGNVSVDSTFSQVVHVIDSCGPVANFDFTPIVCLGQCYSFENTSTGGSDYFWVFEGAENPLSEEKSPTEICYLSETGEFSVTLTVTDEFGSSTSLTQQVVVVNPLNLDAGPDRTINQGTATVLSATGGSGTGEFIWQPYEDVVCFSCPSTNTVPVSETTTFVVYYEESGGCLVSDTVTIFVEESFAFGIPNSFSPNDDGVNDLLYVRGSNITDLNLVIYNRYGQKVFQTTSQNDGWDGTQNGRELDAGVFGYSLEINQTDVGRTLVKGEVNLVR